MKAGVEAATRFAGQVLIAAGALPAQASITAEALVWNDVAGRTTHGLWRLQNLVDRLESGGTNGNCQPKMIASAAGIEMYAGDNGDGVWLGHLAMSRAIDLARINGIGAAGVNNSNHFGTGAWFVEQACQAGMLGLAFSNAVPKQAPYGGHTRVLGTNPVAFGAPRRGGRSILVDFSTSAVAGSTLRKSIECGEPVPIGNAVDRDGQVIIDPAQLDNGALLPAGGAKGYGLALMVEILCGVITGASISHQIHSFVDEPDKGGGIGHFFVAVNISSWMSMDEYFGRIDELSEFVLSAGDEVRLPGEERWRQRERQIEQGILYDETTRNALADLAARYGIACPWETGLE